MATMIQPQIGWALARAMSPAEYDTFASEASRIEDRPADDGFITLDNGTVRPAQWMTGCFTGKRVLQYKTRAGNWRNPTASAAQTFRERP